jgi:NAD(P)-dependent dehydrogenase (short-subunit alcohol dehydrogenase family)
MVGLRMQSHHSFRKSALVRPGNRRNKKNTMPNNARSTSTPADNKQSRQPGTEHAMNPQPEYIKPTYTGSGKLDGKVALITGGDSGIGRAVSVHFAQEGADIAVVYLDEDKDAKKTQELVHSAGRKCHLIKGDVRDSAFCKKAVEETVKELGGLNILVNNAAMQQPQDDIRDMADDQLEDTFKTNILAYFHFAAAALNYLNEDDCIINTTSVTAYRGSSTLLDYSSTKGAIVAFTRSLSANLAKKKIRVNAVAPGPVWTPLIVSTFDEKRIEAFGKDVPLGRPAQPSELGPAYVFLASDDASYITGQVLHVNGGEVING